MYILWKIMFYPFQLSWRLLNLIREFLTNFLLIMIIFSVLVISCQIQNSLLKIKKGALILDLVGTIVDKPVFYNKFRKYIKFFYISNYRGQENSLYEIVKILRQAKDDKKIYGLILSLKRFKGTDLVSLQYLGKVLSEFRNSGKPIFAIGDSYSQEQYFLASYAKKIYLTPQGEVNLHGFSKNIFFYKSLLDKLKINTHIFRIGKYKTAVEPLLRDNMSIIAKSIETKLVNNLWINFLQKIANNRHENIKKLFPNINLLLSNLRAVKGDSAQFALNNKWVDEVIPNYAIESAMAKIFGWNKLTKSYNGISIYDYKLLPLKFIKNNNFIAVISINGMLIEDKVTPVSSNVYSIISQIRDARKDPKIKAIICKINSPGGSVSASELIREEFEAARMDGKPIVVSMGSVAASGGYWISTPANYIIASPITITGSIGIFGIINTFENSLSVLGIHSDGVTTSPLADSTVSKMMSTELSKIIKLNIENNYNHFVKLVAKSRHKSFEEIEKIGQGRIWIGSDAVVNGLIDELGDFDNAVQKAVALAKIKNYQLNYYNDKLKNNKKFLIQSLIQSQVNFMVNNLHKKCLILSNIYNHLKKI